MLPLLTFQIVVEHGLVCHRHIRLRAEERLVAQQLPGKLKSPYADLYSAYGFI